VNEEPRSDDFGLFGQVQKTYDSNGSATITYYSYDAFGCPAQKVRPGDSFSYPTTLYLYTDAYSGGGLQGQSVVNTGYDALVRAVTAYVPESEATTWAFSRPTGWNTRARTQTGYDALGRTTVVTATDGSVTRQVYNIAYNPADPDFATPRAVVYQIDANNHFTRQSYDVYGQLRSVSESSSTWPNWGTETRTRYAYDTLA